MKPVEGRVDPMKREGRRPRDLARQLGIAPQIIYDAIACGEFGRVWRLGKSGKAIVIPEEAVQRWLSTKEQACELVA